MIFELASERHADAPYSGGMSNSPEIRLLGRFRMLTDERNWSAIAVSFCGRGIVLSTTRAMRQFIEPFAGKGFGKMLHDGKASIGGSRLHVR